MYLPFIQSISKVPQCQTAIPTLDKQPLHSSETILDFFLLGSVSSSDKEAISNTPRASLATENIQKF